MNTVDEINHSVLQKLIIIFLGFLTLAVIMQSCTYHQPCSAYSKVDVELDESLPEPTGE